MGIVLLLTRLLLAVIFALSGLAKLADRSGSRQALLDFGVFATLATPFAVALPLVELVVAGSLIPTVSAWWGALGALALLLLFTAVVGYHLVRGHTPKCHCFGQISSEPIGWSTFVRNLILCALAGVIISFGGANTGVSSVTGWLGTITLIERIELSIGGLTVALLAVGGVVASRVLRQQRYLLQRFQELEAKLTANGIKTMVGPALSLGATDMRAPAFHLPDLSGNMITLDALLSIGRPVVLIFSDPDCGPCNSLVPEIGRWQRDYAGKLTLALLSRGALEPNRIKASQHGIEFFLLQHDREVAEKYQAQGTPCAVLIHSSGTMSGSPVCGAEQIRGLIAQAVGLPVTESSPISPGSEKVHILPITASRNNHAAAASPSRPSKPQIGETAPNFTLPDLSGKPVSLVNFLGQQVLLLFWDSGCGFCEQMIPDLKDWEAESSQKGLTLLVVSAGKVNQNRVLRLSSPVLVDEDTAVGPVFGVHGTPMAVLVDAKGKIGSEVAAGAPAVLALARSGQILP